MNEFIQDDCLDWMREQPDNMCDLVVCSPPYEAARTYGIDFNLKGQAWVDWAFERYIECVRICGGLVVWVVEGQTRQFRYSATPALLMADLHRAGIHLRKPPLYRRDGIPGSGGPDFLKNVYEFCVCGSKGGRLPWSDNVAMGQPCRFPVGGAMSYRNVDGVRKNERIGSRVKLQTRRKKSGLRAKDGLYVAPDLANPGNIIDCGPGGGGHLGSKLSHENEAPFPEKLAEFFIRSFCAPGGIVLDIFSGSGTTAAVAYRTGRQFIGVDIRESQVELGRRRLATVQRELIA